MTRPQAKALAENIIQAVREDMKSEDHKDKDDLHFRRLVEKLECISAATFPMYSDNVV